MTPQMRNFYKLEKRWKEAEVNICIRISSSIFVIIIIKSIFFAAIHISKNTIVITVIFFIQYIQIVDLSLILKDNVPKKNVNDEFADDLWDSEEQKEEDAEDPFWK
jgi:hypothetical protein